MISSSKKRKRSMRKFIKYKGDYIVSSYGEVFKITKKGIKKRKQSIKSNGYLIVGIHGTVKAVHRVVMEAFHGHSDLVVDHKNGNKQDNNLDNLEYVTQQENVIRYLETTGGKRPRKMK